MSVHYIFFTMEDDLEKLSLEETSTKTHIDIVKTVTGPPIEEGSKFPANGSRGPKGFLDLPGGKSTQSLTEIAYYISACAGPTHN